MVGTSPISKPLALADAISASSSLALTICFILLVFYFFVRCETLVVGVVVVTGQVFALYVPVG